MYYTSETRVLYAPFASYQDTCYLFQGHVASSSKVDNQLQNKHDDDDVMEKHVNQRLKGQSSAVKPEIASNTLQQQKGEHKIKSTKEKFVWRPKKQPESTSSIHTEFWLSNNSQKGATR